MDLDAQASDKIEKSHLKLIETTCDIISITVFLFVHPNDYATTKFQCYI